MSCLRPTLDFLLNDWLQAGRLAQGPRFADHSRETFDAVLDTCERIAREKYAPFNLLVDTEEPRLAGDRVILPQATQATHEAHLAYVASGMIGAAQDDGEGGMQLPYTIEAAAGTFFATASVSIDASLLTKGNANLLLVHGTRAQKAAFARPEFAGRFAGTMCLPQPQAGSSPSGITTGATPDGRGFAADPLGPRFRLEGDKMWFSAGEHELAENIVHLVPAEIPGPDGKLVAGTRGISLFIVPKADLLGAQGGDGGRQGPATAGRPHRLHRRARDPAAAAGRARQGARSGAAARARGHPGRLGQRPVGPSAGQGRALHAGLQAPGDRLGLAGRAAGGARRQHAAGRRRPQPRRPLFLPLRVAPGPGLAARGGDRNPTCATMPEEAF
ncbi:MAG: Butyryl-CoA dehydrogenase (Short-chain-acyl-CoA dehydrogenase)-like protein [Ramlibacter sp.]|nr:Butyryl-CoA dehydrogenase (Short-chain-acyl-CoA dehydrogenase)-like protein [Ramlibacter sp.]